MAIKMWYNSNNENIEVETTCGGSCSSCLCGGVAFG